MKNDLSRSLRRPLLAAVAALGVLCAFGASAEQRSIHFDRYTLEDGLSLNGVNAIVQDQTGFMWFATQDGLNRFDGYTFEVFSEQQDDSNSLSNSWVWSALVDSRGALWAGTDGGGLNRFDPYSRGFDHFRLDSSNPTSLSNDTVRVIFEDRNGRLWIGTEGGLNLLLEEGHGTFRRFTHNRSIAGSLSHDDVRSILEDSFGALWIGTSGGGLNRLDREQGGFVHYRHDPADPLSISSDMVRTVAEDRQGNLWVGTDSGLNLFDRETGTFRRFTSQNGLLPGAGTTDNVRSILQDNQSSLWVGTDGGLLEWLPKTNRFRTYTNDPTDPSSLAGDSVMSIHQDRGGVLWVGTREGLSKWNPNTSTFGAFTASDPEGERLSSNTVYSLAEGAGNDIWVGTYGGGLNRIDRDTGRIQHYRHDPDRPDSLGDDLTPTLFVDSKGQVWVGTVTAGLYRFEEASDSFVGYRHDENDPTSLSGDGVTSIFEDDEGALWIGTFGDGLNRFDPKTEEFFHYKNKPEDKTSLGSNRVLVILGDSLGGLWIGTHGGGLSGMDIETGRFTRYGKTTDDNQELLSDKIWALHEDSSGNLWIGTQEDGLYRWNLEDRRNHNPEFIRYGLRNGLPSDTINGILEDARGVLWISSNRGLSTFDPKTGTFRNLDRGDGLLSNEFNQGAHLQTRSGEMFFGGSNGLNFFHPDDIGSNPHRPPIVLTSLLTNNLPSSLDRPLADIESIQLKHTDHVLSFEFASLDFTAPDQNQYAYKLEGFDVDWVQANNHRFANYTNLDPGDYIFRVKASNNDGLWNEQGLAIPIIVASPPWKSWWAYALYALSLASGIFFYVRMQSQKLEKEAEYSRKLEREVQSRTRELAERNSDLEQANNMLQQASFTDSLTGLRNRRYLMSTISEDIALVDRYYRDIAHGGAPPEGKRPDFLFLIFDLDGFKEINDTYGHAAGDQVLVQVKEILETACRSSDTVIRWGGDEFLIVGRYADRRAAEILSDRIRSNVDEHAFQLGNDVEAKLSCSIGFAYYPFSKSSPRLMNWEQVVAIADRALYIAKNSGRNAWVGIQETEKTTELTSEDLIEQVNDHVDRLVADGYLALHSSIDDEQELVWAWG